MLARASALIFLLNIGWSATIAQTSSDPILQRSSELEAQWNELSNYLRTISPSNPTYSDRLLDIERQYEVLVTSTERFLDRHLDSRMLSAARRMDWIPSHLAPNLSALETLQQADSPDAGSMESWTSRLRIGQPSRDMESRMGRSFQIGSSLAAGLGITLHAAGVMSDVAALGGSQLSMFLHLIPHISIGAASLYPIAYSGIAFDRLRDRLRQTIDRAAANQLLERFESLRRLANREAAVWSQFGVSTVQQVTGATDRANEFKSLLDQAFPDRARRRSPRPNVPAICRSAFDAVEIIRP